VVLQKAAKTAQQEVALFAPVGSLTFTADGALFFILISLSQSFLPKQAAPQAQTFFSKRSFTSFGKVKKNYQNGHCGIFLHILLSFAITLVPTTTVLCVGFLFPSTDLTLQPTTIRAIRETPSLYAQFCWFSRHVLIQMKLMMTSSTARSQDGK
jgi:hypothetical protein